MRHSFSIATLVFGLCTGALAQQPPAKPAKPASSVQSTAPTNPTDRLLQDTRPSVDERQDPVATPQVAIPLQRTAPNPVALKPGKAASSTGRVDDAAARCLAARTPGSRSDCPKP
jgi:hypothetical protein